MRLWSVHPSQLDRRALVAGWREGLLAQKVLTGGTKGYTKHPQLLRFRATAEPIVSIATYLWGLADEADRRGYTFNRTKLLHPAEASIRIPLHDSQLAYEWSHLCNKVTVRDPEWFQAHLAAGTPLAHPLFDLVPGDVESWEVGA